MTLDDKIFVMDTFLLQAAIDRDIDISDLKVVRPKKKGGAWYVARKSTGRGIARVLDNQF
jgi:hypothetical protein